MALRLLYVSNNQKKAVEVQSIKFCLSYSFFSLYIIHFHNLTLHCPAVPHCLQRSGGLAFGREYRHDISAKNVSPPDAIPRVARWHFSR
jgi:hypothetical protein